jgi:hypothetical protein
LGKPLFPQPGHLDGSHRVQTPQKGALYSEGSVCGFDRIIVNWAETWRDIPRKTWLDPYCRTLRGFLQQKCRPLQGHGHFVDKIGEYEQTVSRAEVTGLDLKALKDLYVKS